MNLDDMTDEQIDEAAREQGWKPEEEWKGEPPKRGFVSAEEFLKAGDKSMPLLSKQKDELKDELDATRDELDELKQKVGRFTDFQQKAQQKLRMERDSAIEALQKERAMAISDADGDKVVETEKKIAELQNAPLDDGPPPPVQDWLDQNPWYEKDSDLRDIANGISLRLKEERPDLLGPAHLEELAKRVKKIMPHKFENPKRREESGVEPARRQPATSKKTFDDLPADAKAAYEDYKALQATLGREYTKAQYLSSYEWEE